MTGIITHMTRRCFVRNTSVIDATHDYDALASVIFVNENENENGEKRENNEFVNEN